MITISGKFQNDTTRVPRIKIMHKTWALPTNITSEMRNILKCNTLPNHLLGDVTYMWQLLYHVLRRVWDCERRH